MYRPFFLALLCSTPLAAQTVPDGITGTFDRSIEACGQAPSMARVTVSSGHLDLAYGRAEVEEVERQGDAVFLRTTLREEGQVEPRAITEYYRIDAADGDRILFKRAEGEPVELIRCNTGASAGSDPALRLLYGTRAGETVTVVDREGLGGAEARIAIRHMRGDAAAYCRDYARDESEACIDEVMATVDVPDAITADCTQGQWTDPQGRRLRLGEGSDPNGTLNIVDRATGRPIGDSFAAAYPVAERAWRALCQAESAGGGRSSYAQLDLADCTVIETLSESDGATWQCDGWNGPDGTADIFVTRGDGRYDVDLGARDEAFVPGLPFNRLGETVEFRADADGELQALIVRYRYDDASRASELAVIRPARDGAASCYVALVEPGGVTGQNERAREIADTIDGRSCLPNT
ncbi:hypothetical protein [Roseobacter sp. HKCCA0434]|uniref:hypothetical protein n=1 Tax=Roseobacter sp. HKCCA0434 TaxID=3079297 RepID=UPI002905B23A|nr:hypothetical protein [Roseobacter sp. HKCCA0434]